VIGAVVGTAGTGAGGIPGAKPASGSAAGGKDGVLEYTRRGTGGESFTCACGNLLQLSPAFRGSQMRCHKCDRITRIH